MEKKNILMVADSYFQFIIESNLRCTIFKEDNVDLVLYQTSNGANDVYKRIKDLGFFCNVYYAKSPLLYVGKKTTKKQRIPKYLKYLQSLISPDSVLKRILPIDKSNKYDILVLNSWGAMISAIFNYCYKRNPQICCYRIEEGFASALSEWHDNRERRNRFERCVANLLGHKMMMDYVKGIYFFCPELVQFRSSVPILQMPKINRNNKELCEFIAKAFNLYKLQDEYTEKFVVFEDGASYFANTNDDVELIKVISDVAGSDNVFVKLHPRTKINRFAPLGITTNKDVGIPWEAILLYRDFNKKVFVTTSSSAAISGILYFGDDAHTIMCYKCMKHQQSIATPTMLNYLHQVQKIYGADRLIIPETIEEYKEEITKFK